MIDYLGNPPSVLFEEDTTISDMGTKCLAIGRATILEMEFDILDEDVSEQIKTAKEKFLTFCKNIWQIVTTAFNKLMQFFKDKINGIPTEEQIMREYKTAKERGVVVKTVNILSKKNIASLTNDLSSSVKKNDILDTFLHAYNALIHGDTSDTYNITKEDRVDVSAVKASMKKILDDENNTYPIGTVVDENILKNSIETLKNQSIYEKEAKKMFNEVKDALNSMIKNIEDIDKSNNRVINDDEYDNTPFIRAIQYATDYVTVVSNIETDYMQYLKNHFTTALTIIKRFEKHNDEFAEDIEAEKKKQEEKDERQSRAWGFA